MSHMTLEYSGNLLDWRVTEIVKMDGRGHSLTIDHGWREVAETALAFIAQQLQQGK